MIFLSVSITIITLRFSQKYLYGDSNQKKSIGLIVLLSLTTTLLFCSDHIAVFCLFWLASNLILTQLMQHKKTWYPAKVSSQLARKNFLIGTIFLLSAMLYVMHVTNESSIQKIIRIPFTGEESFFIGLLLTLTAMSQGGIWPFHTWVLSSLNSPTPVSALMHAGLINGGGFLLTRFAPIILQSNMLLNFLFIIGISSAVLGTIWKLIQSDIKRMLACSTIGQMGFMLAQCGLGLFPAAISHLFWHGLFKAYLFLSSASAAKEKRIDLRYPPKLSEWLTALGFGILSGCMFSLITNKNVFDGTSVLVLVILCCITGTQFSLTLVRSSIQKKYFFTTCSTIVFSILYSCSVVIFQKILPSDLYQPTSLNAIHALGISMLLLPWLMLLFGKIIKQSSSIEELQNALYVKMLNSSQPHPESITTHRTQYSL